MRVLGVIPARYDSSRLPGKPLADICGKPMIWWVYREAVHAEGLADVVIAADDIRIEDACRKYELNVIMTSPEHDTPTSRLFEVSQKIDADKYLMIMGDEPLVDKRGLNLILSEGHQRNTQVSVLTNLLSEPSEVIDFSNQKMVADADRNILMISRSPIPYPKGTLDIHYEKVTGVQLFSKEVLDFYMHTQKSLLEQAEENDLMRFVEHGIAVKAILSPFKTVSVDTRKDLVEVRGLIENKLKQSASLMFGGDRTNF